MAELFGTDGIRGLANQYPMTAEIALKTGRAIAKIFNGDGNKIIIGKDTRVSGAVFEHALIAGICSMGVDVCLAGVIPTPGVAFLAASMDDVAAGIVISASHNPYYDNGIKVFKGDGYKPDNAIEEQLEKIILDDQQEQFAEGIKATGQVTYLEDAGDRYQAFLKKAIDSYDDLSGIKAIIDCSNGASSLIAPDFFRAAGIDVNPLFIAPDGVNINDNCGSQHTEAMIQKVIETKSDIGLAFDGDADRLIAVDENGRTVTGDQIIAICAKYAKEEGFLDGNCVVTTVMSNMGLVKAFRTLDIKHLMANVGDRNVMIDMLSNGAVIGGEDSGHMIFLNAHTTGDGMLSALKLLEVMHKRSMPLSELAKVMTVFPQKLVNIDVKTKPELDSIPEISEIIKQVEDLLGDSGRVLVRYSGTQPMCRVMVEAETVEDTEKYCDMIADVIREIIG